VPSKGSHPEGGIGASVQSEREGHVPLPLSFLERSAAEVVHDLLGCRLISIIGGDEVGGRIVETEAYIGPQDPASHAAARIGRTSRNDAMFGPAGTA
jgi:DNA-3-methyladenine glycosylase